MDIKLKQRRLQYYTGYQKGDQRENKWKTCHSCIDNFLQLKSQQILMLLSLKNMLNFLLFLSSYL